MRAIRSPWKACLLTPAIGVLATIGLAVTTACSTGASPTRSLPETPQELRSYPSPAPDYRVVYEHPEERWRISYPAGWAITDSTVWEDYSGSYTDINDPSWDWDLSVWRSSLADYEQYEWKLPDSRSAADDHLYSRNFEREEGDPYPVFLRGEDVIIKDYTGYLLEYLQVGDGGWASWVVVLFLVVGTDEFEVTLEGPPDRMMASYSEMRDIILSFEPPNDAPSPVALPPLSCASGDAVTVSRFSTDSKANVFEGERRSVTITVEGNVTNTCNRAQDVRLLAVVYDKSGEILHTDENFFQGMPPDRGSLNPVLHLAPYDKNADIFSEDRASVWFDLYLDPDTFDRATSVAILVVPP
ncbi:MAG: hypothetical protein ABID84_04060 [Chloroflexota bacterium]